MVLPARARHVAPFLLCLALGCAERPRAAPATGTTSSAVDARIDALIAAMTIDEKTDLLHGINETDIRGVPRLGIPTFRMSDGPMGITRPTDASTVLPNSTAMAATFDPDLVEKAGTVLALEAKKNGFGMLLAPAINIVRTPIGGRSFEYLSEDPLLVSRIVAGYVRGVRQQHVAACVKHYAANSVEIDRMAYSAEVDERTMREIYLPGFRAAVDAGALCVMAAYNKVNATYASENRWLVTDVLKNEWGFGGFAVSDWGATHSTVAAALAGLDVEMPGDAQFFAAPLANAVRAGEVPEAALDDKVRRVLGVMSFTGALDAPEPPATIDRAANAAVSRRVAEEGIVLLKNAGGLLPLDPARLKRVAVIGPNAVTVQSNGGGSSGVPALYEITPLEGLMKRLGPGVEIVSAALDGHIASGDLLAATLAAKSADTTILFVGTDKSIDHEGYDRPDLGLLAGHDELVTTVLGVNPNSIVVLVNGSAVQMPWARSANAIVEAWYAGMDAGTAIAEVLFGDVNPSGKLPITFPAALADSPAHANGDYPVTGHVLRFDEGVFVGYRYFDTMGTVPLFPFGHGLSYTTFRYDDIRLAAESGGVAVSFSITNTGPREGREAAQVYVRPSPAREPRPDRELKGFQKVNLAPGETKAITVELDRASFAYFSPTAKAWTIEPPVFEILVGSSSRDIRLRATFDLESGTAVDADVPDARSRPALRTVAPQVGSQLSASGGCAVARRRPASTPAEWIALAAAAASIARRRRRPAVIGWACRS